MGLWVVVAAPTHAQTPAPPDPDRDDLLDSPWGFTKAFAGDAWATMTTPFVIEDGDVARGTVILATALTLFALDGAVHERVVDASDSGVGASIEDVGEFLDPVALMGNTNRYWIAGMLVSDLVGAEYLETVFKEILFSHWIAGAGREIIGGAIGRRRPEGGLGEYSFSFRDGSSFPSGHAATITQLAAILSHHIDRWPATVLLYGLAGTVVWERVSSDSHWPSDAVLGAAWGWGVAQVVMRRREVSAGIGPWGAVPTVDPATGSLGLRIPLGPNPAGR